MKQIFALLSTDMPRLILLFLVWSPHFLVAQQRPKLFRAILTITDREQIDGILYSLTDSTVILVANTREAIRSARSGVSISPVEINANIIRKLVIRRKGHGGRGAAYGAGAGLINSLVIAVATRPVEPTVGGLQLYKFENGFRLGVMYMAPFGGAFYGAIIGGIIPRKRHLIGGDTRIFRGISPSLHRFAIQQQLHGNPAATSPR